MFIGGGTGGVFLPHFVHVVACPEPPFHYPILGRTPDSEVGLVGELTSKHHGIFSFHIVTVMLLSTPAGPSVC